MPTTFRPYAPNQELLLPVSLQEWLPEDHIAYFISEVVEELDLSPFYTAYEGDGRRKMPYEPSMMLKVLIYAYATGVFSSRQIARKLEEDVAFRILGAGNFPRHRTICAFRQRHLNDFKALFTQVVQVARATGLVRLGTVSIDGTKVKANASKHKAMSYKRLKQEEVRLSEEIKSLCGEAVQVDELEDARFGVDRRGDELPEELRHRQGRLEKIRAAKARLEAEQREADRARGRHADDGRKPPSGRGAPFKRDFGVPEDVAQSNFTDPESRIMNTKDGFQQCYNGQLVVDDEFQLIVGNELTANASDHNMLIGLLDGLKETLEDQPERLLADAGYRKEDDFEALESRDIDAYICVSREGKGASDIDAQKYPATHRMLEKLSTPEGEERYRERKHLSEAVNGWIKHVIGFRRFSVRGLSRVSGEWDLVCLATNLRRMRPLLAMA
ncbi:MAG: IS1182 family transposase [Candidatus Tectomicrobia bacterium]